MVTSPHRKRALVLTAGFGEGHNTAAKNWAEAIRRLEPSADVEIADLFRSTNRYLSTVLEGLYSFTITNTPSVWRWLYNFADSADFSHQKLDLFAALRTQLTRLLEEFRPDIIANTYPLYPQVLARIRANRPDLSIPPVYTMVTDSVSINSVWFSEPSDRYLVADTASKRELESAGILTEQISVTGFPVSPLLTEIPCDLEPGTPPARILYFPCTSRRHVRKTLAEIPHCLGRKTHWTLVLGHHEKRLYHTIRRFKDERPDISLDVLGWTDEVPRLMRSHHLVIGKAGGATVHEALTARCPMVINYVVPGQEEGNADLLEKHGCAVRIRNPGELPDAIRTILGGSEKWHAMRKAAAKLREPLPSARVAQIVLEHFVRPPLVPAPETAILNPH